MSEGGGIIIHPSPPSHLFLIVFEELVKQCPHSPDIICRETPIEVTEHGPERYSFDPWNKERGEGKGESRRREREGPRDRNRESRTRAVESADYEPVACSSELHQGIVIDSRIPAGSHNTAGDLGCIAGPVEENQNLNCDCQTMLRSYLPETLAAQNESYTEERGVEATKERPNLQ
ncbi:hypothetical protein EYF80_008820 [Liparis tanakae]|uniref:Uncharacterized protein n=1 Tax=Liparis tanakae TaxID=230148 RepID=A0A4Z2ISE4_9TELE|nr:hypothetical protein EYF80_008820 [Liparis tanakae]